MITAYARFFITKTEIFVIQKNFFGVFRVVLLNNRPFLGGSFCMEIETFTIDLTNGMEKQPSEKMLEYITKGLMLCLKKTRSGVKV